MNMITPNGIELPIETYTVDDEEFHLIPVTDSRSACIKCCFTDKHLNFCDQLKCLSYERPDNTAVVFKVAPMITTIWTDDKTHGLLTDDTGNQALVTGNKTVFIGVDKSGKACFRDIHDCSYFSYSDDLSHIDTLEDLNQWLKQPDVDQ